MVVCQHRLGGVEKHQVQFVGRPLQLPEGGLRDPEVTVMLRRVVRLDQAVATHRVEKGRLRPVGGVEPVPQVLPSLWSQTAAEVV